MKRYSILLAVVLACSTPSCATYHALVDPATNVAVSTYTVQGAEHTLRAAKDTFDLFFGLVHDNHDFVVAYLPQVYTVAQRLQVSAPPKMRQANAVKNAFKNNRNAENQTNLNTIMAVIVSLMTDAQGATKQIQNNL